MALSLTSSFRELCAQATPQPPVQPKRRRAPLYESTAQPTASTSSAPAAPAAPSEDDEADPFLVEAYKIHNHISTLVTHLQSVRRQYLSIAPPAGGKGKAKERGFTEQERDEVDLQAKILLKRCLERILVLEREEEDGTGGKKKGKAKGSSQPPTSQRLLSLLLPPTSTLSLPSFLTSSSSQHKLLLAAHHASILFHLHRSLSEAGALFSSLQEERVRRSSEASSRVLGSGLSSLVSNSTGRGVGGGRGAMVVPKAPVWKPSVSIGDDGVETERGLSEGDVQMFERENSELLRGYDEHLDQITKTTQTLAQISTLQSLLAQSLLQQSETSSRLLLEAGQGVADVRAGNKQLEKAKERGGSGRIMVLTFLIGAAFALLFLDYMS